MVMEVTDEDEEDGKDDEEDDEDDEEDYDAYYMVMDDDERKKHGVDDDEDDDGVMHDGDMVVAVVMALFPPRRHCHALPCPRHASESPARSHPLPLFDHGPGEGHGEPSQVCRGGCC